MSAGWLWQGHSLCHNVAECGEVLSKLSLRILSVASLYWGLGVVAGKHFVEPWQDFTGGALGVFEFLESFLAISQNCAAVCSQGPGSSLGDIELHHKSRLSLNKGDCIRL